MPPKRQRSRTPPNEIRIWVKPMVGKRFDIKVAASTSIEDLKILIRNKTAQILGDDEEDGLPPLAQRLRCEGVKLEDGRILSNYNIQSGDLINLRWSAAQMEYFANAE